MSANIENPIIDLTIIIVAWNVKELVEECLLMLRHSSDTLQKEILFVDNGSKDGTADFVRIKFPEVDLIESPTNLGFIRANNLAYQQTRGKYVLMLNSDAFVFKSTLQDTINFMDETPDCGALGVRLVGRDGVLQPSARYFPTPFKTFIRQLGFDGKLPLIGPEDDLNCDHNSTRECDWVVGCFLLTRKKIIDKMGYFLRDDFFMYNDDNDLCLRIKKEGWKVYFYPTDVVHLGGATAKKMGPTIAKSGNQIEKYQIESRYIYYRKNYSILKVVSSYSFMVFADLIEIAKTIIKPKREYKFRDAISHIILVTKIMLATKFGNQRLH